MNADEAHERQPGTPVSPYTADQATASLRRAAGTVIALTIVGFPIAWFLRGWQSALLLLVGALISASGLWEWKRLMAALMARMDTYDLVQSVAEDSGSGNLNADVQRPSIAFAVAGFVVRLLLVLVVLYVSLKYLHGSVFALAAGLALGVFALTVEGVRLLRSGTI